MVKVYEVMKFSLLKPERNHRIGLIKESEQMEEDLLMTKERQVMGELILGAFCLFHFLSHTGRPTENSGIVQAKLWWFNTIPGLKVAT